MSVVPNPGIGPGAVVRNAAVGADLGDFNVYDADDWAAVKTLAEGGTLVDDDVIVDTTNDGRWRVDATSGLVIPASVLGRDVALDTVDRIVEEDPADTTMTVVEGAGGGLVDWDTTVADRVAILGGTSAASTVESANERPLDADIYGGIVCITGLKIADLSAGTTGLDIRWEDGAGGQRGFDLRGHSGFHATDWIISGSTNTTLTGLDVATERDFVVVWDESGTTTYNCWVYADGAVVATLAAERHLPSVDSATAFSTGASKTFRLVAATAATPPTLSFKRFLGGYFE